MGSTPQHDEPTATRSTKTTWIALTGISLVALVYLILGPTGCSGPSGDDHPAVGTKLESLELSPLTVTRSPLRIDDLRGKVVLLNFWGTWCPPCRVEFPHLIALRDSLSAREDFQFVSVSCSGTADVSRGETPEAYLDALRADTQRFLDQRNVQMTTFADPLGHARKKIAAIANQDSFAFPTTLLLDREGVIRGMWVGFREGDQKDMESLTREVLAETPRMQ